jgi:hypothetical protein
VPAGGGLDGVGGMAGEHQEARAHPLGYPARREAVRGGAATVAGGRTASVTTAARYRRWRISKGGVGGAAWGEEDQGTAI